MNGEQLALLVGIHFLLLFPGAKGRSPKFIGSLENVTISQGRDATFTCTVTHLGGHRVAWIKSDSKAILAIHNHVITNNNRLQVTHNDKDTWTLHIRDVKTKDAGEYMCQVNSVPMVSQVASLEVVVAPEISDKLSTQDVSVAELGTARFVCHATGNPLPSVSWERTGNPEFGECNDRRGNCNKIRIKDKSGRIHYEDLVRGSQLEMAGVTRAEMGAYQCVARNGVPPATSKVFKLIVNFKPQIEVANQVVGAPIGTFITLACTIQASPKPITYWQKRSGGEMLVPGSKYNITERSVNIYSFVSTLQMLSIDEDDFGEYSCVSKNTIGQSEEHIELHRIEREEFEAATTTTTQTAPSHVTHAGNTYLFFEEISTSHPKLDKRPRQKDVDFINRTQRRNNNNHTSTIHNRIDGIFGSGAALARAHQGLIVSVAACIILAATHRHDLLH